MNKSTILIISENNNRITSLVEETKKLFYSLIANNEEDAINQFLQSPIDAVLFGKDVNAATQLKLSKIFNTQQPNVLFIYDDGNTNLADNINRLILSKQKENKPAFSFKDDALKNAGLNISIQ
ncbi:MAG TPA: hypothetical protein PK504_04135 [Ferruginibacter sp.]|nr:hypothetical protein [Ferruginibacter sp.]HRE62995.1 hypothetical protein [Ferruginibacter sp.]